MCGAGRWLWSRPWPLPHRTNERCPGADLSLRPRCRCHARRRYGDDARTGRRVNTRGQPAYGLHPHRPGRDDHPPDDGHRTRWGHQWRDHDHATCCAPDRCCWPHRDVLYGRRHGLGAHRTHRVKHPHRGRRGRRGHIYGPGDHRQGREPHVTLYDRLRGRCPLGTFPPRDRSCCPGEDFHPAQWRSLWNGLDDATCRAHHRLRWQHRDHLQRRRLDHGRHRPGQRLWHHNRGRRAWRRIIYGPGNHREHAV